ncbi:MAG: glucose-6-phosphate isomerase, partial [Thalassobaculaceae bacterium]
MPHYHQNIDTCRQLTIGDGGVTDAVLAPLLARAEASLAHLRAAALPHLTLADQRDDLDVLADHAASFRRQCDDVLVLGTGGSNLGAVAVCALATDGTAPRLHFMANVDPASFTALFRRLDPARTGVIAISKSGGTAETLSQMLSVLAWRRAASVAAPGAGGAPMVAISEPGARPLRDIAAHHGFPCLDHAADLGGRFSVLATAMLPALVAGIDAAALRAGAASARDHALSRPAADSPPAMG